MEAFDPRQVINGAILYFDELAQDTDGHFSRLGRLMRDLTAEIQRRDLFSEMRVSRGHTLLYVHDPVRPFYVSVTVSLDGNYQIAYPYPRADEPWDRAMIIGWTDTIDGVLQMVHTAFERADVSTEEG